MPYNFEKIDQELERFAGKLRGSDYSVHLDKKTKGDWLNFESRSVEWKKRKEPDFNRKISIYPSFDKAGSIEFWHFSIAAFYELKEKNYFYSKSIVKKPFIDLQDNISNFIIEGYSVLSIMPKADIPLILRKI